MSNKYGKNNPNYRTGYCVGKHPSFYNSWQNMKGRCLRKSHPKYYRYGGRGIKIEKSWLDIKCFAKWAIDNGWKEGLTIDRIDNDGNYEPSNCRWVNASENSRKKSTTKLTIEQAQDIRSRKRENWYDLAKEYNVCHGTIWFIMNKFTHVPDGECSNKLEETKIKNIK